MSAFLTSDEIYAQLEALVLPTLEFYHEDLTQIDRATLKDYTGPFLLSYRPTGTHLLVLGREIAGYTDAAETGSLREQVQHTFDRKRAEIASPMQTHFLYCDGRSFTAITREEALGIADETLAAILAQMPEKKRIK